MISSFKYQFYLDYIYLDDNLSVQGEFGNLWLKSIYIDYMYYFKRHYCDYIKQQQKIVSEKPWSLLNDKTLKEAIDILIDLGY